MLDENLRMDNLKLVMWTYLNNTSFDLEVVVNHASQDEVRCRILLSIFINMSIQEASIPSSRMVVLHHEV